MPELLLAGAITLVLGGGAALVAWLSWQALLVLGLILLGLGTLGSLPASVVYHLRLRRALTAIGPLPRRWWLEPMGHHAKLDDSGRDSVLPWFYLGAASFIAALFGGLFSFIGIWRAG